MPTELFQQIEPKAPDAVSAAFARVLQRRAMFAPADTPWSLAELGIAETDYRWLTEWLRAQSRYRLVPGLSSWRRELSPSQQFSNAAVTGTLLWLLFTEHVRRHGSEGNFWNALGSLPWHASVADLFFLANRNPAPLVREVLQLGAEELRLRNVFGVDGTLPWFDTGFLQFGFTRTGFERRLPEWLAGQTPTLSIRHLLGRESSSTASRSFQELWNKLLAFRRSNLTELQLRSFLADSPWILSDWTDALVKRARERLSLDAITAYATDREESLPFLDVPRLIWEPDKTCHFEADWINLDTLALSAETYVLRWGSAELSRLIRQPDGSFAPTSGPQLRLGWNLRRGVATLEAVADHSVAASQPLLLWDETEVINLFDRGGRRCDDPYRANIAAEDGFSLCVPDFVALNGNLACAWPDPTRQFVFVQVAPAGDTVSVAAMGEELWTSDFLRTPPVAVPEAAAIVRFIPPSQPLKFHPWEPAPIGRVRVDLDRGLELKSVRWAGRLLTAPQGSSEFSVELHPDDLIWPVTVILGVRRQGASIPLRRKVELPFRGTIWRSSAKVRVLEPRKLLNVHVAATDEFRIRLPDEPSLENVDHYLIEAGSVVRRHSSQAVPLGRLAGYGGSLVVRRGPYNEAQDALVVAEQVIDNGVIRNVQITPTDIVIHFAQEFPVRPEHTVVLWTNRHELCFLPGKPGRTPASWTVPHRGKHGIIYAVGVSYNGVRVGAWFQLENWSANLQPVDSASAAREAAVALRWLRAPLLAPAHVENVRAFARRWLAPVLGAWLNEDRMVFGQHMLSPLVLDSHWCNALEELLGRGRQRLDAGAAHEWFQTMNPEANLADCSEAVARAVWRLAQVSPQLAASFVRTWVDGIYAGTVGPVAARELKDHIRRQLRPTPGQWQDLARNVLHVADEFLDTLARRAVESRTRAVSDQNNLQLLSKHPAFRRQCAVRLF